MGVQEFTEAWKKGQKVNDTVVQKMFEGYVSLGKFLTGADGLVNMQQLEQPEARLQATEAFYKPLTEYAASFWGASTTDADKMNELAFRTFGFDYNLVKETIEKQKQNVNALELISTLQRDSPAFGYFQRRNQHDAAKLKITDNDAEETIKYTKAEGKVDKAKLTVDEIADLLSEYLKEGVISARFLRDKRYAENRTATTN